MSIYDVDPVGLSGLSLDRHQLPGQAVLVDSDGEIVARFRPMTDPEADAVVGATEAALPA